MVLTYLGESIYLFSNIVLSEFSSMICSLTFILLCVSGLTEAINPYIEHIPQELREEYLDDIIHTGSKMQEKLGKTGVPLTNVVVVATKP